MNRLKCLYLSLICLMIFGAVSNVHAQANRNIQSISTVAVSEDALKIGRMLRHSALEFRQFSHKSVHERPENIFLSNDNHRITVFQKYPQAEHVLHNMFRFQHDGNWGIVDDAGNIIIAPVYRDIWLFEVLVDGIQKTFLWVELPNPDPAQRQGFRATYQFLIDIRTGITLNREPMYSLGISAFDGDVPSNLIAAQPVAADGPHGYMDLRTGEMRIPAQFLYAMPFYDDRAVVLVTHEHAADLCRQKLKNAVKPGCSHPHISAPPCHPEQYPYDPQACFIAENMDYYGYGVIDTDGALISRFDYDYIQSYHHQKAVFKRSRSTKPHASIGYMDIQGKEILYGYLEAMPFNSPYAAYVRQQDQDLDTGWNWIDTKGTVYAINVDPDNVLRQQPALPKSNVPRLNFVTPFEIQGALYTEHSDHLDTYILAEPIVSHSGDYISAIIVNENGHIIWPEHWNDPCSYSYDIVVWPEQACLMNRIRKSWIHFFEQILPIQNIDLLKHNYHHLFIVRDKQDLYDSIYYTLYSWALQFKSMNILDFSLSRLIYYIAKIDVYRFLHNIFKRLSRIQTYRIPALESYISSDDGHYVRIGFGPRQTHYHSGNPGFYAARYAHGILNADTGRVLFRPGRFPEIRHAIGSLFIFGKDGLYGLMNTQADIIVPPQFLDIDFIVEGQQTTDWIPNGSVLVEQIHANRNADLTPAFVSPFVTMPKFKAVEHRPAVPKHILLRVSVFDKTDNPHSGNSAAQGEQIPVIRFYYDALTGEPKPELTDKAFIYTQRKNPLLTHEPGDESSSSSVPQNWFIERIQTIRRSLKDPEPVSYDVIVNAKGQPVFPGDLRFYSTVSHLRRNTAIVQSMQPTDPGNPLELRCLDTQRKAAQSFASFMPSSVSEGSACIRQLIQPLHTDMENEMQHSLPVSQVSQIQENRFLTSCHKAKIVDVESCSSHHVTPFIQGTAWIKPKGAMTFKRINTQGQTVGAFEIKADKAVFHHGVYRFSTTVPSPESGWKYAEIIVSSDGRILWPREWHQPDADHLGNIVYPKPRV